MDKKRQSLVLERNEKITRLLYPDAVQKVANYLDKLFIKENKIFWIDDENIPYINDLFMYFMHNNKFCTNDRTLHKGILTIGNVGSGKSMLFEGICRKISGSNSYISYECFMLANRWEYEKHAVITELRRLYRKNMKANHIYCDDLGEEEMIPYYGTYIEVMEKIITFRNKLWVDKGLKLHVSTNMSLEEIEQRYGERVKSRLLQMCNVLYLGKTEDSLDRRTTWKKTV